MVRRTERRHARRRALAGALVCLSFALQQLLVTMHFAWHHDDHHADHHDVAHDARAELVPARTGSSAADHHQHHHPHPIADHLGLLAEPAVPSSGATKVPHAPHALAPVAGEPRLVRGAVRAHTTPAERVPRPPPPRSAAPPRAPPILH